MSEQVARLLLNESAAAEAPPGTADAAALLARAKTANRRRLAVVACAAAVVLVLSGTALAVGSTASDRRSGEEPSTSSSSSSAWLAVPAPSPTVPGPFCGWNDELAPAVMATLPVEGTWGRPLLVPGICGKSAGVMVQVTEGGRTGQVWAVVSQNTPEGAREDACVNRDTGTCEEMPDWYVYWNDHQETSLGRTRYIANGRLATKHGVFIDVTCTSDAIDEAGQPLNEPPMSHAPCTGLHARALALELVKTDWLG